MAIPKEFSFSSEDDFNQRFVIPLLQRLGFTMTVNYHGTREFGRDLIFAEFDRFGHVRYHALQAKYVPSISVNDALDLVTDCKLAFTNKFTHPQTGNEEFISTFYAVNGGSIAEGAVATYFASLVPSYGGNVRLLAGKDLVVLDRWASANRSEMISASISGMQFEIRHGKRLAQSILIALTRWLDTSIDEKERIYSADRLRLLALKGYLQQPLIPTVLPTQLIHNLWETGGLINWTADSMDGPISVQGFKEGRLTFIGEMVPRFVQQCEQLEPLLISSLASLGSIIPL